MMVGSLFSGYGGLDLAVGGTLAWYSEIEPAACNVMAAHHPDVANLGDITTVDWASVPPVDVITGGYPCQPFSHAGRRKGTNDERHLWPHVRDAISHLRPGLAVLENVAGHLSLGMGEVLGDLAEVGYDARWGVVRASDAGAPHRRERVFIVGFPADADSARVEGDGRPRQAGHSVPGAHGDQWSPADSHRDRHGIELHARGVGGVEGEAEGGSPERERTRAEPDARVAWGQYEQAIRRWEPVIGRPAPPPTIRRGDRQRLNSRFVEWMMGLPEGWVTGHGLSSAQELKMLGNGVVPQQARLALTLLEVAA